MSDIRQIVDVFDKHKDALGHLHRYLFYKYMDEEIYFLSHMMGVMPEILAREYPDKASAILAFATDVRGLINGFGD